jgi:hypothetical protein
MAAEKMKRQWWRRWEKKGEMTTLFKKIRGIYSKLNIGLDTWEERCWDDSGDYDIEEAMWLKELWLEWMTRATDEFSTYKDLVSVGANAERTRSGSNMTLADIDELSAYKYLVSVWDKADLVELEVQHEVCGNVLEESCSNVLKEVCQDVARESCYDVPSCEENCDEESSLDEAEIDDPQGNVQLRDLDEEFVKQDAADELVDVSVKLDNDEKEILAREEESTQLGRDAEEVFNDVNMSGKEWTQADEDPPDEAFGGGIFIGEASLEFPKTDVKMVDISSLQFADICGGSLVEVTELSRGEFCQEETVYERNLMDGKVPEVITRGSVTSSKRVELAEEPPPPGCVLSVSFEKTSLVEDVAELGMREKKLDAAANITAQVTTSRPENYEMIERHLARVKMKMVDTVLKAMEVVVMYEKANMEGQSVSMRTQLEVEAVLGLNLQV